MVAFHDPKESHCGSMTGTAAWLTLLGRHGCVLHSCSVQIT